MISKNLYMMARFPQYIEDIIANFRGIPPTQSSINLRTIQPIGELIEQLFKKKFPKNLTYIQGTLRSHWKDIVGPILVDYCRPQKIIQDNILLIAVSNSTAQHALMLKKNEILQQLQQIPICRHIDNIRCRQCEEATAEPL